MVEQAAVLPTLTWSRFVAGCMPGTKQRRDDTRTSCGSISRLSATAARLLVLRTRLHPLQRAGSRATRRLAADPTDRAEASDLWPTYLVESSSWTS